MRTTLSSKGQVVLPALVRGQDHLEPGDEFEVERLEAGQYLLRLTSRSSSKGMLAWLRGCPDGDFFQPVESESTDTIGRLGFGDQ